VIKTGFDRVGNVVKNIPASAKQAAGFIAGKVKTLPALATDTFQTIKKQPLKSAGIAVVAGLAIFGAINIISGAAGAIKGKFSK